MFRKDEKGAIVVEATLSLTTFLFLFFMIFSLISAARCEAILGVALNNSAKEISQYSYLYGLTGINGSLRDTLETDADDKIDDVISNVGTLYNSLSGVATSAGEAVGDIKDAGGDPATISAKWDSLSAQLANVKSETSSSANTIKTTLESICKDPKDFMFGIAKILANDALNTAKSRVIAEPVSRVLVKKHLEREDGQSIDAFLHQLGVVKGTYLGKQSYFNGLDFSKSQLFPNNTDEINLIVNYKIQVVQLLNVDFKFDITQKAKTKAWFEGDGTRLKKDGTVDKGDGDGSSTAPNGMWSAELARHLGIMEIRNNKGYQAISAQGGGLHGYNKSTNTFAIVSTYNPFNYCSSVSQVDKAIVTKSLEELAKDMKAQTSTITSVTLNGKDKWGNPKQDKVSVPKNANNVIYLAIPEDPGLEQIFKDALKSANTNGVKIEIVPCGGNGLG